MNPMISMILKWEKELEHPDHTLIQHQNFARLLKTSVKTIGIKKQTNFTDLVTHQTYHELA
jgi:hypothetical protein